MRITHIVQSLEERHGGPSKSARSLANHLVRCGNRVDLLSTVEQGQQTPLSGTDDADIQIFPRITPRWLCRSPDLQRFLKDCPSECLHNHALWLLPLRYASQAASRKRVPLVISPRGMLSGWAYTHRRWRKQISQYLVHPGALSGATGWHATSAEEADDIRRLGFKQPICVAPNGVPIPSQQELTAQRQAWLEICPAANGRKVALFYSRFHRKKRLRELLDLWISKSRDAWFLLIVGVVEDYQVSEIDSWIREAGAADRIAVFDGTSRPAPYGLASLFLLPSHSENFGLVIAEALAAGVPALVTDSTPWRALPANNSGWCVSWTEYAEALNRALATSRSDLESMGQGSRLWVERDYSWNGAAHQLNDFYRQLIDAKR